jgi:hypothetical protein
MNQFLEITKTIVRREFHDHDVTIGFALVAPPKRNPTKHSPTSTHFENNLRPKKTFTHPKCGDETKGRINETQAMLGGRGQ